MESSIFFPVREQLVPNHLWEYLSRCRHIWHSTGSCEFFLGTAVSSPVGNVDKVGWDDPASWSDICCEIC